MYSNADYLRRIDGELNSLKINMPRSWRINQLENVIRPDVVSRMSEQELLDYANRGLTDKQIQANREEELRLMESNKDSNSI